MADIAEEAGLQPDEPMLAGAGKLLVYLWQVAWKEASGTVEGDAEALHDMRVAMRRLRSALRNFEGPKHQPLASARLRRELAVQRKDLGRLGDALGAVRDFDVLQEYLVQYSKEQLGHPIEESSGLGAFRRYLLTERAMVFAAMVKRVNRAQEPGGRRERFARFALGLPAASAPPLSLREAAGRILPLRVDEVLGNAPRLAEAGDETGHHEMRKSLRRLRYALELLAPCFSAPVKPHLKVLVRLQDYLGEMQDRAVLREAAHHAFGASGQGSHRSSGRLSGYQGDAPSEIVPDHARQDEVVGQGVPDAQELPWPADVEAFLAFGESRRSGLLNQARELWSRQQAQGFPAGLRTTGS